MILIGTEPKIPCINFAENHRFDALIFQHIFESAQYHVIESVIETVRKRSVFHKCVYMNCGALNVQH